MSATTEWDAIVIGAGLGGLSAAAHLAKAGKRVVVVEQSARPGGLWTSFSRQGIIFDISTHWVTDPQGINRMLAALGSSPVDFVQLDRLGRYLGPPSAPGMAVAPDSPAGPGLAAARPAWDIVVGPDAEAFKESVRRSFPEVSEQSLTKLTKTAVHVSRLVDSLPAYSRDLASVWTQLRATLRTLPRLPRLYRLGTLPAERYFDRLFPGPELAGLRAALFTLAPIAGMPAIGPLVMLGTGLRGRLYSPRGGSQVLAEAFAEAALANGVAIRYNTRAASILSAGRVVQGVLLDDRSELRAPAVVSAVDAKQTFFRLLSSDRVPESFSRILEAQPVSEPYALISAVTSLEPATAGFEGCDVFLCPSLDASRAAKSKEPEDCSLLLVFPQYREPGSDPTLRGLQIVAPSSFGWRENWATKPTPERGPAYHALKKEWSDHVIQRVQEYLPQLSSHLVAVDVATPITMYRRALNTGGAPVGWHYKSRRRWKQRVPFLKGLYQAGHWVGPSGALWVTRSGKWAAELVLRDVR
jgi:phytoene dehydrogenase-like protein